MSVRCCLRPPKQCRQAISSGAKWQEQTAEDTVAVHFTWFNFTKSVHFFPSSFLFTSMISKKWNIVQSNFSALGVFEHPATTHLLGLFREYFRAQNPLTITAKCMTERAGRFGASWHFITAHSWTQTLSCVDSRSSSLGVAKAGTLKLNFGRQTRRNPKILFGVVIYGL